MDNRSLQPDDPLNRAIIALRDTSIPDGPRPDVVDRTIGALRPKMCDYSGSGRISLRRPAAAIFILACTIATLLMVFHKKHNTVAQHPQSTTHPTSPLHSFVRGPASPHPHLATAPENHNPPPALFASAASVSGRVFYHGPPVARRAIDLRNCPQCMEVAHGPIYDDSLIVNEDGTLQNVVVSISAGLPSGENYSPPPEPVVLDQRGCMFRPHVVASMVGQNVIVKNSDPLLHVVHSMDAEETPAFNFAQPTIGERAVEPIRVVETFRVKCDLHPWMNAWVRVFNHPYFAVTQADGKFAIKNLPPGHYRIKAWHERLGVQEKEIVVQADGSAKVDFTFPATNAMQNAK